MNEHVSTKAYSVHSTNVEYQSYEWYIDQRLFIDSGYESSCVCMCEFKHTIYV